MYDEFYKGHIGKMLYIRPLQDIISKFNLEKFASSHY